MRGLFVFSKINDIIFHRTDDELKNNLIKRGIQNEIISQEDSNKISNGAFRNLIVQMFSPMVTSQRIMANQFDNVYKSIENEDNSYFVFKESLGYVFVYVDHTKYNSVFAAERQLNTYKEFTRLLCGPSIHILGHISGDQDTMNDQPSHIMGKIFEVWNYLYQNEMSYLVEGVERLLINRHLSCTCVKLMENVLSKMRSSISPLQEVFCHAFILVGGKLLYLFSSRNAMELSKGDLLMIIALVKVLHSDQKESSDNETHICYEVKSTIKETLKRRPSFLARVFESASIKEDDVAAGIEVTEEEKEFVVEELFQNQRHLGIFLRNKLNNSLSPSPYMLHSLAISDQMKVVILGEVPQWNVMSSCFSHCAETLHNLIANPLEGTRCSHTKNILDQHFQRISTSLKKLKLTGDHEKLVKRLIERWENLKRAGLNDYLQNGSKLILAPRLEISMTGLCEQLQEVFEILIYRSLNTAIPYYIVAPSSAHNLKAIEEIVSQKLAVSMDYLLVKASDNISMTSYFQDFPGLIHYIYIDRNTGYMIAPSLSGEYKQLRPEYLATATKKEVWNMVESAYILLSKERYATMFQDESFYYSFFLWFEDFSGKPLKPKTFPSLRNSSLPGIISGDFYRKLCHDCFPEYKNNDKVQVYELFCIHVGVTTPPTIVDQSRKLAAAIWEISGAAHTPLDLL